MKNGKNFNSICFRYAFKWKNWLENRKKDYTKRIGRKWDGLIQLIADEDTSSYHHSNNLPWIENIFLG